MIVTVYVKTLNLRLLCIRCSSLLKSIFLQDECILCFFKKKMLWGVSIEWREGGEIFIGIWQSWGGRDVNYWILEIIGKTLQEMDFPFSPYNYIRKCKSSTNILSTQLTVFMRYASRTAWFSLLIWNPLPQIFPYIIKTALHLDHHQ